MIASEGGLAPVRSRSPTSASAWPSATRWSSISRNTASASASCCRTCSPRTTSSLPTPTRSWRSTSSPTRRRSTATRSPPAQPEHGVHGLTRPTPSDAHVRVRPQARAMDDQRPHLGGRGREQLHARRGATRRRRRGDLGVQERQWRLVPSGARAPRRLQDPRPQRPAAVRLREGAEGRGLRRRGRDRARDHALRPTRSGAT